MKSNKGFTLIELLAVIVILAVIALIATPTILGVIDTARRGAAESSVLGYVDAVEKQAMINQLDADSANDFATGTVNTTVDALKSTYGVSVKGKTPANTDVVVKDGEVQDTTFDMNGYVVNYSHATGTAKASK